MTSSTDTASSSLAPSESLACILSGKMPRQESAIQVILESMSRPNSMTSPLEILPQHAFLVLERA